MVTNKPYFKAALNSSALELFVYSEIGADFLGAGITVDTVRQSVGQAGDFDSITMRINSPGGDAFEGVAISNYLRSLGKPITVFIDGVAASAASILAMAGDEVVMGEASMMMIHNAWTMVAGEAKDLRAMADLLDKVSHDSVAAGYQRKTGLPAETIQQMMDSETWLSAQEAVEQGFATSVATYDNSEALAMAKASFGKALKAQKTALPEHISTFTPAAQRQVEEIPSNLNLFEARLRLFRGGKK